MKLGYLLLNLALVATALFVYDVVRREPARGQTTLASDVAREEVREPARTEEQPLLTGAGVDDVVRRIEALEARFAGLPGHLSDVRVVPGGTDPSTSPSFESLPTGPTASADAAPGEPDSTRPVLPDLGDPKNPRIDPQTLEWFRAGMEEVDRIRDQERRVAQETARLARIEVSLTAQQQEAVIAATLQHRTREIERGRALMTRQGVTREDREALQAELRTEYVRELEKLVPVGDAEKIADGMVRPRFNPGGRRVERRGGETAPAGNGR